MTRGSCRSSHPSLHSHADMPHPGDPAERAVAALASATDGGALGWLDRGLLRSTPFADEAGAARELYAGAAHQLLMLLLDAAPGRWETRPCPGSGCRCHPRPVGHSAMPWLGTPPPTSRKMGHAIVLDAVPGN